MDPTSGGRWVAVAAAIWLPVLFLSCPARAGSSAPLPPACQRPEAQLHVWLVAARPYRASPGCVVYHRSWKELRKHRVSLPTASKVRVWPVTAKKPQAAPPAAARDTARGEVWALR